MEIILSPSILSADFAELGKQIKSLEKVGVEWIHVDVMDGMFVPNLSFGLPIVSSLRRITSLVLDVHLMIHAPERYLTRFIDAGADMVTFHAEATDDIDKCIGIIKENGAKAGLAISPGTPYDVVVPYLDKIDMILCMTVEPGYGGQAYMKEVEAKISKLRELAGEDMLIQVDGGISPDNVIEPIEAGANVIVAGSAVFNGDIEENTKELAKCAGLLSETEE